jgi:hypothetical protein
MALNAFFTLERLQARNQNFLSTSSTLHQPETFAISLRKQKRKDFITKKRQKASETTSIESPVPTTRETFQNIKKTLQEGPESSFFLTTVLFLHSKMKQKDRSLSLKLSKELGLVKTLSETLKSMPQSSEEFQATLLCIQSLSSGPEFITSDLLLQNIDDFCINLLGHFDVNIVENAIWCLSNLSVDSLKLREKMIKKGTVLVLLEIFEQFPGLQELIIWTLRNVLEGKDSLEAGLLSRVLNTLSSVLRQKNKKIFIHSLWALSLITDKSNNITQLVKSKCFHFIIKSLDSSNPKVILPALRSVGNISAGTVEETQALFDREILDKLYKLFESFSGNSKIKKYLCWTLSNLSAGTRNQIAIIVAHPILMKIIKSVNDCDENIRKEAIISVFNIASLGKHESVWALINIGFLKEASGFLSNFIEGELTFKLIETLIKVYSSLKVNDRFEVVHLMNLSGFYEKVQKLVLSRNLRIQNHAQQLMDFMENANEGDAFCGNFRIN